MLKNVVNFVALQIGWFALVLSIAWGTPWIGIVTAILLVSVQLGAGGGGAREWALVLLATVAGAGLDSMLVVSGWVTPTVGEAATSAPLWLTLLWFGCLWANFATVLRRSLSWLEGRYWLATLFGAIGGPLAYFGAAQLGALLLSGHSFGVFAILAGYWALAMPALLWLSRCLKRSVNGEVPPLRSQTAESALVGRSGA